MSLLDSLRLLFGCDDRSESKTENIEARLEQQEINMTALADAFAQMKSEVNRATTVDASARALLKGTTDQLTAALAALQAANPGVDVAEVQAVVDQLKAGTDGLAQDVAANTAPGAPVVPPAAPTP